MSHASAKSKLQKLIVSRKYDAYTRGWCMCAVILLPKYESV